MYDSEQASAERAVDIEDLRQCLARREVSLILHVKGLTNPTDVGTKSLNKTSLAQISLQRIVDHGIYLPDVTDLSTEISKEVNYILQQFT